MDDAVRAQLWLAAGAIEIAVRRRPLPVLVAAAGRAAGSPTAWWFPVGRHALTADRLDELAAEAGAAWRGSEGCLPRSLLRCWLAASVGRRATLVVGVRRKAGSRFAAHAWVELDGAVHGEVADPTALFQPIATFPMSHHPVAPQIRHQTQPEEAANHDVLR
ncbi:lasso peptide biosynthesis B2 protein [Pseudofrankia asymbiotica]|nr:lasso peptide biosynthesis B2 protein [Pseudofrankia asymbiotica]